MSVITYLYRTLKGLPPYESIELMQAKRYIPSNRAYATNSDRNLSFRKTDVYTFGAITPECDGGDDLLSSLEIEKRTALIYESARK